MKRWPIEAKVALATGAVTVIVCAAWLLIGTPPKSVVVTKTDRGFLPQHIVVNVGDTIIFANESLRDIWPASDAHPSHGLYPAFDAKAPVAVGASWSFTFDRPGAWAFHDHLDPGMTGRVVVRGGRPESVEECLARLADKGLKPECWAAEFTGTLEKKGLAAAFALADEHYENDATFRTNCHDVMHIVGQAAYRQFRASHEVANEPATAYCGYGFYHGFIETMLVEEGSFANVRQYCEDMRTSVNFAGVGQCYHGIGHAVFDSLPGALWGEASGMTDEALRVCEEILPAGNEGRELCSSGVYNSLANAMSAGSYYLSYEGLDPDAFCSPQPASYKKWCYAEVATAYLFAHHTSREDTLAWIRSIAEEGQRHLMYVYFGSEAKRDMHDFPQDAYVAACEALQPQTFREACVEGVLQGMREEGQPGKVHEISFAFCEALTDPTLLPACISYIVNGTSGTVLASDAFKHACAATAGADAATLCVPGDRAP